MEATPPAAKTTPPPPPPPPPSPTCSAEASGSLAVIIIPSLLSLSTVVVVILILCSLHHRNRARGRGSWDGAEQSGTLGGAASVNTPKVQNNLGPWELPEDLVLEGLEFLQSGSYGPVCGARLRERGGGGSSAVVLKCLRDGPERPEAKEFLDWVLFHAKVCKHDNVVRMLHCQTRRPPMFLLLDACSPGNLLRFLWTLRNKPADGSDPLQNFSERSVFVVAKQVAAGLDYLMSEHRLVHGDVAARNVLLGADLSARVSGLGVAFERRRTDSASRRRAAAVPVKWLAPETITTHFSIDRSDAWSFGVLLYELVTLGAPPYPELEPRRVLPRLQASYRMERPHNCGAALYDLMKYCWMWSFKERPAFSDIIKLLEASLHLAAVRPLRDPELMDEADYNRKAGLSL